MDADCVDYMVGYLTLDDIISIILTAKRSWLKVNMIAAIGKSNKHTMFELTIYAIMNNNIRLMNWVNTRDDYWYCE